MGTATLHRGAIQSDLVVATCVFAWPPVNLNRRRSHRPQHRLCLQIAFPALSEVGLWREMARFSSLSVRESPQPLSKMETENHGRFPSLVKGSVLNEENSNWN